MITLLSFRGGTFRFSIFSACLLLQSAVVHVQDNVESLIRKAGQHALKSKKNRVEMEDFEFAVGSIKGSVGSMDKYYRLRDKFMHRQ